jgi:hypothetical protein
VKRNLEWDPEKEVFANDAEANRMLSRALRAPWQVQKIFSHSTMQPMLT